MAIAVFDYTAWITRFPEFSGAVSEERAALLFSEAAALYLDNTECSPVQDVTARTHLLYLMTSHLAALSGALNPGGAPSGLVGRVSSATEGSVSVSTDMGAVPGSVAWYQQTSYGLSFWQASKQYRIGRRYAAPRYNFEPRGVYGWPR